MGWGVGGTQSRGNRGEIGARKAPSSTIPHLAIRRIARGRIGGSSRLSGPEVFKWLWQAGSRPRRFRHRQTAQVRSSFFRWKGGRPEIAIPSNISAAYGPNAAAAWPPPSGSARLSLAKTLALRWIALVPRALPAGRAPTSPATPTAVSHAQTLQTEAAAAPARSRLRRLTAAHRSSRSGARWVSSGRHGSQPDWGGYKRLRWASYRW